MVTDATDPRLLAAQPKHFLVKRRNGTIFLVAEVERYQEGDPDYDDASSLFKESYDRNPAEAAPVKQRPNDQAQTSESSHQELGGALTIHFQAGD